MTRDHRPPILKSPHLLAIDDISPQEATALLDLAETYVEISRQIEKRHAVLRGCTQVNLFFEASTRTRRVPSPRSPESGAGADVVNMAVASSSLSRPDGARYRHDHQRHASRFPGGASSLLGCR